MRYLFADCSLDTDRRELCRGTEVVPVEPQVFDLLVHLLGNRERVVSKDDLLGAVWHGRIVSESALNTRISAARAAIGDNGEEQRLIKTLPRKGVRFVGEVREDRELTDAAPPLGVAVGEPAFAAAAEKLRGNRGMSAPDASPEAAHSGGRAAVHWPQTTWTFGDASHLIAGAFQGDKLRLWSLGVAALLCIGSAYLIGRSLGSAAPPGRAELAMISSQRAMPNSTFKDCDVCPEMVALPLGEFMMGSAKDDAYRAQVEGPPRRVVISRPFAIGRFEITVDQFAAFVEQAATTMSNSYKPCRVTMGYDLDPPRWIGLPEASFRRPGFEVTGSHPAGCISWYDAQAYVAWLKRRTGKEYRLPTEAEWEYAARAGTTTSYSFGNDDRVLCDYARFSDLGSPYAWRDSCRSDITTDGPIQVGKLKPNAWGIFDMHGNVGEWVEDCWTPNWAEIPIDGSAYSRPGNCEMGVTRGGAWISNSRRLRTAYRNKAPTHLQAQVIGFRVALTLGADRLSERSPAFRDGPHALRLCTSAATRVVHASSTAFRTPNRRFRRDTSASRAELDGSTMASREKI